ncbi:MAG: hypothetical protein COX20_00815 [Desulfobacterales bacterium CG23_combo_of_CG06-09_8_20_14_all_52_9]|nr:MAG: hypothetical protein COX20_00815 [Desulfobacterales bacterium CG23_combo_of_CG06-09_8_20_14_all_52_9]
MTGERKAIKAIYFPNTVVQETVLADLTACFTSVETIQPFLLKVPEPMSAAIEGGFLTVCPVMADQEARLTEAFNAFQAFARMHGSKGDLKTRFVAWLEGSAETDDEKIASQVASLMKKGGNPGLSQKPEDLVFRAALFLHMAQQYDIESFEVQKDLKSLARTEKKLFQSLTGEASAHTKIDAFGLDTPEDYMIPERLAAWARLFLHGVVPEDSDKTLVWVTHSRPAMEHLLELAPLSSRSVHLHAIPTAKGRAEGTDPWKESFQERLVKALEDPDFRISDPLVEASIPFGGHRALLVTVHAVDESPSIFFGRAADLSPLPEFQRTLARRTLVVHLSA